MAIITPIRQDAAHPQQIKKHSAALRFWHWANAIVITGSLLTVLLNSTLLKGRNNAAFIKAEMQNAKGVITDDQAKSIAHAMSDHVWDIHVYFGYALAALLLLRLLMEFFQLTDQKFIRKFKSVYRQYRHTKQQRELARHELAVKTIYAVFYLLLIIMVTTGLVLAFEDQLVALKPIRHTIKDVHGFCMYLVLAFIAVHLIGVFLAERKPEGKGIVSDMINGGTQQ